MTIRIKMDKTKSMTKTKADMSSVTTMTKSVDPKSSSRVGQFALANSCRDSEKNPMIFPNIFSNFSTDFH
jgi:hypothetical protein